MKLLSMSAAVALTLSLAACGGAADRNADATMGSDTANTATVDTPSATMPVDSTTAGTDMGAGSTTGTMGNTDVMGNPMNTGACEGLTGQAHTDCMNRAGPAGMQNELGTPTDPSVPQPSNTDATTPPQS